MKSNIYPENPWLPVSMLAAWWDFGHAVRLFATTALGHLPGAR